MIKVKDLDYFNNFKACDIHVRTGEVTDLSAQMRRENYNYEYSCRSFQTNTGRMCCEWKYPKLEHR